MKGRGGCYEHADRGYEEEGDKDRILCGGEIGELGVYAAGPGAGDGWERREGDVRGCGDSAMDGGDEEVTGDEAMDQSIGGDQDAGVYGDNRNGSMEDVV